MLISLDYLVDKYHINPKNILHCGANTGQERFDYKRCGFKDVIWIEAIPGVYNELKENIKPYPNDIAINVCVSDKEERVVFNISNNESQSSSFLEFGTHKEIHPTVKYIDTLELNTMRLDKILSKFDMRDFDFLNFDLQGAEMKALSGMGAMLGYFNYAYLEVNFKETYLGCGLISDMDSFMARYGFMRVETSNIVGGSWADAFYVHASKFN